MALQWINKLSGSINQGVSPQLIADNEFEILVNVTQSYTGTLSKRQGATLLGTRISASNPIRGLSAYNKTDGTHYLHAIHQGILYVYNEGTGTFNSQENAAGTELATDSEVDFANYINRHYFIGNNSDEYLRYVTETGASVPVTVATGTAAAGSTGTTLVASTSIFQSGMVGFEVFNITDATSATITSYTNSTTVELDTTIGDTWDGDTLEIYMDGKYLATNGAYMMVAGSTVQPRRAYWTGLEADTFDVTADYGITTNNHTGVASFGNGRPFIVFSDDRYMTVEPNSAATDEVTGFGCISHRSIANLRGGLIWLSRDAFYFLMYNQAFPIDISKNLRNDKTGDAIMNKIAAGTYAVTAAGVIESRYFCALRDLSATVKGQTLNDCVLELDYESQTWRIHTFTQGGIGSVFTRFIDENNTENLYAGSLNVGAVYKLEDTTTQQDDNDSGTAADVAAVIRTKHYEFGKAESWQMKNIDKIVIKYKSDVALTVKYAIDGESTYTTFANTLPIANTNEWNWRYFTLGKECRTISIQIEAASGDFIIYGMGFELSNTNNSGIDPV